MFKTKKHWNPVRLMSQSLARNAFENEIVSFRQKRHCLKQGTTLWKVSAVHCHVQFHGPPCTRPQIDGKILRPPSIRHCWPVIYKNPIQIWMVKMRCWDDAITLGSPRVTNIGFWSIILSSLSAYDATQRQCSQIANRGTYRRDCTPCPREASRETTGCAAFVSSSSFLRARTAPPTSPYSPRFLLAMLFFDFMLSVRESKLRIVFFSTPCKRDGKQTTNFEFTKYLVIELILLFQYF